MALDSLVSEVKFSFLDLSAFELSDTRNDLVFLATASESAGRYEVRISFFFVLQSLFFVGPGLGSGLPLCLVCPVFCHQRNLGQPAPGRGTRRKRRGRGGGVCFRCLCFFLPKLLRKRKKNAEGVVWFLPPGWAGIGCPAALNRASVRGSGWSLCCQRRYGLYASRSCRHATCLASYRHKKWLGCLISPFFFEVYAPWRPASVVLSWSGPDLDGHPGRSGCGLAGRLKRSPVGVNSCPPFAGSSPDFFVVTGFFFRFVGAFPDRLVRPFQCTWWYGVCFPGDLRLAWAGVCRLVSREGVFAVVSPRFSFFCGAFRATLAGHAVSGPRALRC